MKPYYRLIRFVFSGFYAVLYALGELKSYNSILEVKRPEIELIDKPLTAPDSKVVGTAPRTSHDQILIQGHLESGALLSYHLRGGKPFGESQGLIWRIYGEWGEIQITAASAAFQIHGPSDTKIEVQDFASGKVEHIVLEQDEWDKLPGPVGNVARLYEAFADGKTAEYPDWEETTIRHRLVEELYRREAERMERPAQYLNT